jgi:hypothetical protein
LTRKIEQQVASTLERAKAEAAVKQTLQLATREGWQRTITILEMEVISLDEVALPRISRYPIPLEEVAWCAKVEVFDELPGGRTHGPEVKYCWVVMPQPKPIVVL